MMMMMMIVTNKTSEQNKETKKNPLLGNRQLSKDGCTRNYLILIV